MKKYIILTILCSVAHLIHAQESENPVDFLYGEWIRKVNSVTPQQAEEPWRGQTTYVEFKKILNGKGLHQISYAGINEVEVHIFYDEPTKKMYGMTIDANGYVWQSEMVLKGNILEIVGKAINDNTVKETIQLTKIDNGEMNFVYTMFKNNKEQLTAKGVFIRVPKH